MPGARSVFLTAGDLRAPRANATTRYGRSARAHLPDASGDAERVALRLTATIELNRRQWQLLGDYVCNRTDRKWGGGYRESYRVCGPPRRDDLPGFISRGCHGRYEVPRTAAPAPIGGDAQGSAFTCARRAVGHPPQCSSSGA